MLAFIIITIARGWNLLFFLITSTDVIALVEEIRKGEPLITTSCKDYVINLVRRLQEKLGEPEDHKFYLSKVRVIFKIILEIWGFHWNVVIMFLEVCIVPESNIWTLLLISCVFLITSPLLQRLNMAWLCLSGIPPKGQRYNCS